MLFLQTLIPTRIVRAARPALAGLAMFGMCLSAPISAGVANEAGMATINVSVWYRERIALIPGAVGYVSLEDVAKMDVASVKIAEVEFPTENGPPWDLAISYDPGDLDDRGRYALRAWIKKDNQLLFTSTEHIPAFDSGDPVEIMLSKVASGGAGTAAGLVGTSWNLVELDGAAPVAGAGDRQIQIRLDPGDSRLSGFSGCNQFGGSFEQDGTTLRFGQMMSTMMACPDTMEQEQRIQQALGTVERFSIDGDVLSLYGQGADPVLKFRAAGDP